MNERNRFFRDLWRLMLPLAFQNLMTTLVSATDALVLARVDQYAVAAVSLAAEINFVMNLFLGAVIGGIAIMAAQYMGKGDTRTVKRLLSMALRYNLLISLVFFSGAFFAPEMLMRIYTNDAGLIATGAEYLRIASWSYLLSAMAQCYLCVMKVSGGAFTTAVIATTTAVVDVAVDIYLVYGLDMGAKGTAISTVAVCAVELTGVVLWSMGKGRIRPMLRDVFTWQPLLEKDFRRLSFPVFLGWFVWGAGYSLSAAVMGHVSADASSAYAIAALVRSLFTCFIRGMGSGAGIIVGRDLGSGDIALAKRDGTWLSIGALVCGCLSAVLFLLLGPLVTRFFVLNDAARSYLTQMIPVCAAYLIALSITTIVISNVFPAGGDPQFDPQITAVTMWLIALPLGCLAAFVFHLPVVVVYIALCLDEFVKILFVPRRFKQYRWLQNITRELPAD